MHICRHAQVERSLFNITVCIEYCALLVKALPKVPFESHLPAFISGQGVSWGPSMFLVLVLSIARHVVSVQVLAYECWLVLSTMGRNLSLLPYNLA